MYSLTVLGEGEEGAPPSAEGLAAYNDRYAVQLPIVADVDWTAATYADVSWWPTVLLLEPDLTVVEVDQALAESVLPMLAERFPQ